MHIDMQPQDDMNGLPNGERDREGAMAKADLYKLANYSLKLFKMMEANTQLEGWVQAKITKAADYIASVYHYMEYEMKFSEYGAAIDDSDVYSESQKRALRGKLMEAKEKIKDLKKAQAEKVKKKDEKVEEAVVSELSKDTLKSYQAKNMDAGRTAMIKGDKDTLAKRTAGKDAVEKKLAKKDEKVEEASGVRATDKKKGKVEKSEKKQYFVKLEKDGATKGMTITADEGEAQSEVRDRAARDARSGGWTVASIRLKDSGSGEELDEAKKATKSTKAKKDYDGDGEVESGKDEVIGSRRKAAGLPFKEAKTEKCNSTAKGKSCPVHGLKECGNYMEGKPSAGMSKDEKSAVAKKASAGKDIGKPGKSFDKVAKAAGGGEKGTKIAAAAMWKQQAKK